MQDANDDLLKGALASRCVLTYGVEDGYKLILGVYYALRAFGLEKYWTDFLTESVPFLCSCKKEIKSYAKMFGNKAQAKNA